MATTIDAENAKQIRKSMDVLIQVTPETGDPIVINNDNLISCVVSLRSDLSILNPTLPESEINVEAYFDEDISEALAAIPDETPVTYQAGYEGDMSPTRRFYLAEQITWADNIMSVHAVDAVHLMGKTTEPVSVGDTDSVATSTEWGVGLNEIAALFYYYALGSGVDIANAESLWTPVYVQPYWSPASKVDSGIRKKRALVGRGHTFRDVIAEIMNLFHFADLDAQYIRSTQTRWKNFWPTYVDAGIPSLSLSIQTAKWDINEQDCGDVKRNTNRAIGSIKASLHDIESAKIENYVTSDLNYAKNSIIGSFSWEKGTGGTISFDRENIFAFVIGVKNEDIGGSALTVRPIIPVDTTGYPGVDTDEVEFAFDGRTYDFRGHYLIDSQTLNGVVPVDNGSSGQGYVYTQTIPWDSFYENIYQSGLSYRWRTQAAAWDGLVSLGVISADTTQATIDIYGFAVNDSLYEKTFNSADGQGTQETIEPLLRGHVWLVNETNFDGGQSIEPTVIEEAFPQKAMDSLMNRSGVTGSFTWKGDPRMQPRDVATFHRLDGTTEEITLENITITHEGGGTSAEITYRKGIC